jgi:hypothetical protein
MEQTKPEAITLGDIDHSLDLRTKLVQEWDVEVCRELATQLLLAENRAETGRLDG